MARRSGHVGQLDNTDLSMPGMVRLEGANGLLPGNRVGPYELIRELGRGGMGRVFAAREPRLGRRVAIKFLLDSSELVAERFLVEARATARCHHDNIVVIHAVDEHESIPYMVLEYLEGETLRDLLSRERPTIPRALQLARPIARALAHAHGMGIVHRDLKPENVLVTRTGQVKVLDFGIAKALGQQDTPAERRTISTRAVELTQAGTMIGTLPYMPPEQMLGDAVDHRADIWAFGILLFELFAGRHPVSPLTTENLIADVAASEDPLVALEAVAPVPPAIAELVARCLRKRVAERAASMEAVARELDQLGTRRRRPLPEGECPFPGLGTFQEADAGRFFGRGRDIARAVAQIRESPFTCIVGPSGVGKSSFVRAGIIPALKESGERWEVVALRPGRAPLSALANLILELGAGAPGSEHSEAHSHLAERLAAEPGLAGTILRAHAHQRGARILVFVDQLEELFTLIADVEQRRAFAASLCAIADDPASPCRVVVSIRSDFVDRTSEHPRLFEEASRGLVFLAAPDRDGLREALLGPLGLVGYTCESAIMVEDILDALDGVPGGLPLLQFAAARLWDLRDRELRTLTIAGYRSIGGITGALAAHADEVVSRMTATMRQISKRLCRMLVTPERTRASVELEELYQVAGDRQETAQVVHQLVAARLLVVHTAQDGAGGTVELVHESLIERWPAMRRWLDEDHEDAAMLAQLAAAARQWAARGRPAGLLWRGEAVDEARRWDAQRRRDLAPRDRAFLEAAFAHARRGRRLRRAGIVTAFLVLAGVAAGASIALVSIQRAERLATEKAAAAEEALVRLEVEQRQKEEAVAEQQEAEAAKGQAEAHARRAREQARAEERRAGQLDEDLRQANEDLRRKLAELRLAKSAAERAVVAEKAAKEQAQRMLAKERQRRAAAGALADPTSLE